MANSTLQFTVRKVTESRNGGFIVTLDHKTEVETSVGKQQRVKSYSTKVLEELPVGENIDVDMSEFDIVLKEFIDEQTGELRRKNWLFPA